MIEAFLVALIIIVVVWVVAYLAVTYLIPRFALPPGIVTLLAWLIYAVAAIVTILLLVRLVSRLGGIDLP
jgi:hypothetical protein